MKTTKILQETTDSRTYNLALRRKINSNENKCFICHPHRGCNANNTNFVKRNWKHYRKTQYKL